MESHLFGKQFIMSFSCKMELTWINSTPLLSKWIGLIYFGGCFQFFYLILIYFSKTITVLKPSHLFLKFLYCWCPHNFSSFFLKLSSNFKHSLLRYLRRFFLKTLKRILVPDQRSWLVFLQRVLASIKCPSCLGRYEKSSHMRLSSLWN